MDPAFRIDFLMPIGRRESGVHAQTGLRLSPLRFIECLLCGVQQAVLLTPVAAALVNLPHPARYAVHKLIVGDQREMRSRPARISPRRWPCCRLWQPRCRNPFPTHGTMPGAVVLAGWRGG